MLPETLSRLTPIFTRGRKNTTRSSRGEVGLMVVLLFLSPASRAISVHEYIEQVVSENSDAIGANKQLKAAEYRTSESQLLTMPNAFVEYGVNSDGKKATPPLLTYDHMEYQTVKFGVEQNFESGLQGKLYYEQSHTRFINAPLLKPEASNYYDMNPTLELSMPLWANGFGRSLRAQKSLIENNSQIDKYQALAKLDGLKADAEQKYWALVVLREILKVERKALSYAEAMLDYVNKRAAMRLGEKSDILQAKALMASKELSVNNAEGAVKAAQIEFNALLNINSDVVNEDLESIPLEKLTTIHDIPVNPGQRMNLKIAEYVTALKAAEAQLTIEKNKPSMDVVAKYALNKRESGLVDTSGTVNGDGPSTFFVGLRFHTPLDFSASKRVRESGVLSQDAARDYYQQSKMVHQRDWDSLKQRLEDAVRTYALSNELVEAQKLKLENEKKQLEFGKSTTFHVLQFEQEYSQSEISRLQIAQQILSLRSLLALYHE